MCVRNKDDFKSEVLKDALTKLLDDPVPAKPLLRTAILSYQSHGDMKKFMLEVVIPQLTRKRAWTFDKGKKCSSFIFSYT